MLPTSFFNFICPSTSFVASVWLASYIFRFEFTFISIGIILPVISFPSYIQLIINSSTPDFSHTTLFSSGSFFTVIVSFPVSLLYV